MTNFPKPVARSGAPPPPYSPGCTRIIYIAACAFLPRINIFRRPSPVRGRDETKTGTNLHRWTFPERAYPSDPRGINNISRDLPEFLAPLPLPANRHRTAPRGPPVEEIASLTCTLRAAILMDTRDSMGTKGCWFNVEGVFVVLMRYNRMDPGC